MAERFHYFLFGLRISSALALPELPPGPGDAAEVAITIGPIAASAGAPAGLSVRPDGALLNIPEVGRYLMSEGRSIVVAPAAGVSDRNLRLFLLGSAFAAILHQRGLLPLHANAIEIDGRAIAFMGRPGAGKSTMAAWFHDRGARILADDVCVVTFDAHGAAIAHSGIPRLRLWREAIEASGRIATHYEAAFDDMDKYNVPIEHGPAASLPLSHLYVLGETGEGAGRGVNRLFGVEAVEAIVANTYRGSYLPMMGATRRHLAECLRLVRAVPVFQADRRWGYANFDAEAAALRDHAVEQIEAELSPSPA